MLNLLAQSTYTYTTTTTSAPAKGALAGMIGFVVIIGLVVAAIEIVSMWKIFQKAGEAGWKAIIPLYNTWTLAEISGKPGWWGLAPLLGVIPFVGGILAAVVLIIIFIELAKAFGKDPVFAVLLILLPIVGFPMLAFGDAKYVGHKYVTDTGTTPSAPTPPAGPAA